MKSKITTIIPFLNKSNTEQLNYLIIKILKGKNFPDEIFIAHSGYARLNLSSFVKKLALKKKVIIKKFYKKKMYPGEARNVGIKMSKNNILGFLDLNTIPNSNWLREGMGQLKNNTLICWGQTYYSAETYQAKIIRASTVGSHLHRTIPGTIFNRKIINKCGKFIENVRAGEDGDWIQRINLHQIKGQANNCTLVYASLNKVDYTSILKKWFLYYSHSKKLSHLMFQRNIYFLFFIITTVLISYNWNGVVAGWNTESSQYIPNFTTITVLIFSSIYIVFRAILLPVKKKTKLTFLLPFNFLTISLFSVLLDTIKIIAFLNFKKK